MSIISIAKPLIGKDEITAVEKVLKTGHLSQGEEVEKFEKDFSNYVDARHAIATNNGTSALHTALAALRVKKGDEVITTTFSFIATATSILMQNAKPVFCDIDPRTYNICPNHIAERISKRTRAIIVVHLFGQPCEMKSILKLAEDYKVPVIEDTCQAHGAEYCGRKVGSLGNIGCFSFYPTKNMTSGEGGMLTTDDKKLAERARRFINHGQKGKYLHESLGYNYRMTDIVAALGRVQLEKLDGFNEKRIKNAKFYDRKIEGVRKPLVLKKVKHVYNQYSIRVKNRTKFTKHLEENGVSYGIFYPIPIHKQPLFEALGISLPNAEKVSQDIVSIPVHQSLSKNDLKRVVEVVNRYE